ncbi:hypothetical protein VN97_g8312 [Penicillium thymicola]|uniref:Uncharacterized protein n=3 Tax=Penicillium TaxID=5073 RepID=A0AAI9TE01_PENTH|nr:hypothetical protein VN97_g8312 [Penicillium thymicola]
MLLSSDRFILMTLAGLCRRPLLGCECTKHVLGGNRNGLRSRHSYEPLRIQTERVGVLPLSARSRTKLGRSSVLISFDNNFWNLYNRDSSLLSEEFSEDICFQGSLLWFHFLLFRWSILLRFSLLPLHSLESKYFQFLLFSQGLMAYRDFHQCHPDIEGDETPYRILLQTIIEHNDIATLHSYNNSPGAVSVGPWATEGIRVCWLLET